MEIITKNAKETFELGRKIGYSLMGSEVLAFVGNLGAGKTTFIQGLAHGLKIKSKIVSTTFILMHLTAQKLLLELMRSVLMLSQKKKVLRKFCHLLMKF